MIKKRGVIDAEELAGVCDVMVRERWVQGTLVEEGSNASREELLPKSAKERV